MGHNAGKASRLTKGLRDYMHAPMLRWLNLANDSPGCQAGNPTPFEEQKGLSLCLSHVELLDVIKCENIRKL